VTGLSSIVTDLRARRVPGASSAGDPIALAWASEGDPAPMLDLLAIAAELRLLDIEGSTTRSRHGGSPRRSFRLRLGGAPFARVEIVGDGPDAADALRAAVPDVPPLAAWSDAIEAERARIADPVAQLLWDVRRLGEPDPRWRARWSLDAAWRACTSHHHLLDLLSAVGRDDLRARAQQAIASTPYPPRLEEHDAGDAIDEHLRAQGAHLLRVVRAAVPEPPPWPSAWPCLATPALTLAARLVIACNDVARVAGARWCSVLGDGFAFAPPPDDGDGAMFAISAGSRALVALAFDETPGWVQLVTQLRGRPLDIRDGTWTLVVPDRSLPAELQPAAAVASLVTFVDVSLDAHIAQNPDDAARFPILDDAALERIFG
jgi:hypothetical protein